MWLGRYLFELDRIQKDRVLKNIVRNPVGITIELFVEPADVVAPHLLRNFGQKFAYLVFHQLFLYLQHQTLVATLDVGYQHFMVLAPGYEGVNPFPLVCVAKGVCAVANIYKPLARYHCLLEVLFVAGNLFYSLVFFAKFWKKVTITLLAGGIGINPLLQLFLFLLLDLDNTKTAEVIDFASL
ncbi:hypothetical protein SDC9_123458 [bioreactor metagenome]|uniref:Uncharacterized protein n=1 Tax=bioreactor metagenome TaxID=1076179 RepID=A0A645CHN4_9ZZZZ